MYSHLIIIINFVLINFKPVSTITWAQHMKYSKYIRYSYLQLVNLEKTPARCIKLCCYDDYVMNNIQYWLRLSSFLSPQNTTVLYGTYTVTLSSSIGAMSKKNDYRCGFFPLLQGGDSRSSKRRGKRGNKFQKARIHMFKNRVMYKCSKNIYVYL